MQLSYGALRYVIGECYYGGHVADSNDKRLLSVLLESALNEDCAGRPSYSLIPSGAVRVPNPGPNATTLQYIEDLPAHMPADAVGLHVTAEMAKDVEDGRFLQGCLAQIQGSAAASCSPGHPHF